ncbi:MAG: hypothetical protein GPJ50_10840 [Candidatus Heimdallarchaeota archaeon]|nr:hypothetical protein [Candidatus Heimdallarchaeota archaeon]
MIGLSYFASILLISIFSLVIAVLIIMPNIFRAKQYIWLIVKIPLIVICAILVILFVETKIDAYYFLGSFFGVGFLIKGILMSNRLSFVVFLVSFMSFSFVFLSIGNVIMFVFCLCFSYLFIIGITAFNLYDSKAKETNMEGSKRFQTISFITLLAFPVITVYILFFLSENQVIWIEKTSFFDLFYKNSDAITFLIVGIIFLLIVTFVFVLDLQAQNKKRMEEPWYS